MATPAPTVPSSAALRDTTNHKSALRGKPKHSSKLHNVANKGGPKKGGGGGKGVWGKPGDELKYAGDGGAIDGGDPNWVDDGEDYYEQSPPRSFVPHTQSQQQFSHSIEDFTRYKKVVRTAALEYLSSLDVPEFMRQVKELAMPLYTQELLAIVVKATLERSSSDRAQLQTLFQACHKLGLLSSAHVAHSFTKLYHCIDDIIIDCPTARTLLAETMKGAVEKGYLEPTALSRIEAADKALNGDPKATASIKAKLQTAINEFYANPNDQELITLLRELKAPHLHFEFVKSLVSKAFDKQNTLRERASLALSRLVLAGVLETSQVEHGFERLLQRVEELVVDVPDVLALLSCFLARAVSDECIAPAFLNRQDLVVHDMGVQVAKQASRLLEEKGAAEKLSRVWVASTPDASEADADADADGEPEDFSYDATKEAVASPPPSLASLNINSASAAPTASTATPPNSTSASRT